MTSHFNSAEQIIARNLLGVLSTSTYDVDGNNSVVQTGATFVTMASHKCGRGYLVWHWRREAAKPTTALTEPAEATRNELRRTDEVKLGETSGIWLTN